MNQMTGGWMSQQENNPGRQRTPLAVENGGCIQENMECPLWLKNKGY